MSGTPDVPGAYLFAFFRIRSAVPNPPILSTGGKQQEYHTGLRRDHPDPSGALQPDRQRIAETVRQAYRDRDRADVLEDEALALLTAAIEGAEG